MRQLPLPALALAAGLLISGPVAAQSVADRAAVTVQNKLAELGVTAEQITNTKHEPIRYSYPEPGASFIHGQRALVGLSHCQGQLVIETGTAGVLIQAYTRGGCHVPGVPSH